MIDNFIVYHSSAFMQYDDLTLLQDAAFVNRPGSWWMILSQ